MAYPWFTVDATPESSPQVDTVETPHRPAAVPAGGVWNADFGKWEVSRKDERGGRNGEVLLYRDDGTLYSRVHFVAGVQEGPFFIYHRNGDVAREGNYVAGRIDGTVNAYASLDPSGERIRACCVPPGAARLFERWRKGDFLLEVFYDWQGRAILSDGRLCPAQPQGLPELTQYDESRSGWVLRDRGLERFWTEDGKLTEEVAFEPDGTRVIRLFDAGGRLQQEGGFTTDNLPTGPFYRRFPGPEAVPYADPRIRQERGAYEAGQAVGSWTFLDEEDRILLTVDRGAAWRDDGDGRLWAAAPAGGDWSALARTLAAEGRVREAFVAAARGAVASGDATALLRLRAEHVVPLTPEREAQWGEALAQSSDAIIATVLDALVCGADLAAAFRALASVLPGNSPAAPDLVEASLLLAPERRMTHLTRALLRFQRGDVAGALADADVIAGESNEAAESLRSYAAIVFRGFDDRPWREKLAPDPELDGVAIALGHGIDDVRHAIAVYATRLGRAREAIRALIADGAAEAWAPPDTAPLLPSGPVALRRETVECDPEPPPEGAGEAAATDQAPETIQPETIQIDEELVTDGAAVPALLAAAHADWAALAWLCWAVGLDRVALPEGLAPHADLGLAMQMTVRRTWRLKDRLATGGLIARSQHVPGFEWQGVEVDALPRHLVEVAVAEYIGVRSMFLWLASDAMSPFQDDIRDA
jgi:hypothetical protein